MPSNGAGVSPGEPRRRGQQASNRESFASVEDLTAASDVVVVATIEAVEAGRIFGDHPANHPDPDAGMVHYLAATLSVTDVVSGAPLPQGAVVEFILPNPHLLDRLSVGLPREPSLFFLRSKAGEAASLGLSAEIRAREHLYYRLVTTETLVRNLDGVASTVNAESPYLAALDRSNFTKLVDRVRDAGR